MQPVWRRSGQKSGATALTLRRLQNLPPSLQTAACRSSGGSCLHRVAERFMIEWLQWPSLCVQHCILWTTFFLMKEIRLFLLNDKTRTPSSLISSLLHSFFFSVAYPPLVTAARPTDPKLSRRLQIIKFVHLQYKLSHQNPFDSELQFLLRLHYITTQASVQAPLTLIKKNCKAKTKNMYNTVVYFCRD